MSGKMQTRENSKKLEQEAQTLGNILTLRVLNLSSAGSVVPTFQATGAFKAARILHCNAPGTRRRSLKQRCSHAGKRDSLEPVNETHTAFAGTCKDS